MVQPMDVQNKFPVRKSKKQKEAFREAVLAYGETLGYFGSVEKGAFGARNVVFGDPANAGYLITAHYDTCAHMIVPNFITPCSFLVYLLYQLAVVLGFAVVAIAIGVGAGLLLKSEGAASAVGLIVYWALLLLLMFGPANKHNANDNTSGVVTVLETMAALPEAYRKDACFVLFDLEEAGLIGSASFAKKHRKTVRNQVVFNLDCVGEGDEVLLFPTKKMKKQPERMAQFAKLLPGAGEKSMTLKDRGFGFYPSDQSNFPRGFGIAAFRRSKLLGLYLGKIHTNRDKILDEKNVALIRDYLLKVLTAAA